MIMLYYIYIHILHTQYSVLLLLLLRDTHVILNTYYIYI